MNMEYRLAMLMCCPNRVRGDKVTLDSLASEETAGDTEQGCAGFDDTVDVEVAAHTDNVRLHEDECDTLSDKKAIQTLG